MSIRSKEWRHAELTERSAAQQHFIDVCRLIDHPLPADVDARGVAFTFEKGITTLAGSQGSADVWKKDCFA